MANAHAPICNVRYGSDEIVLTGDTDAIHAEAEKIIKRFVHSTQPLGVIADTEHEIVLAPMSDGKAQP